MRRFLQNIFCSWWLVAAVCGEAWGLSGDSLPPLGSRAYILGTDGGRAPVAIYRDGLEQASPRRRQGKVLRDPSIKRPFTNGVVKSRKPPPAQKAAATPREKAASLRFGKVTISGRPSRPRVDFAQEPLRLERTDEPVNRDFFDKVFIPAREQDL